MKTRNGFTIVEIIVSLVILVAIGLVVGLGLNKVFDKSKTDDYDTFVNKIISSADVYLTNNSTIATQLQSDRGYVLIKVADLIAEGLLDEDLVNPETGEKLSVDDENDLVKATLDINGILNFTYPAESVNEAYLEAQNVVIQYGENFVCSEINSYNSSWETPALRLVNADGTVNFDYELNDIITDVVCDANLSVPGTYSLNFIYILPGTQETKELKRSLIISPSMEDVIAINASLSKSQVIINSPITVSVNATNRKGETFSIDSSKYNVNLATNVAGTFDPVITYLGLNSDQSSPTTTVHYEVLDNITEIISEDNKCTKQYVDVCSYTETGYVCSKKPDGSCYYTGEQTNNNVSYLGQNWKIYKKNSDNSIGLIFSGTTGSTYAFTRTENNHRCSPSACCNSINRKTTDYFYQLSQNPNDLNTHLTNFLNNLTGVKTYIKSNSYDISQYGTVGVSMMTTSIGLLSYSDYKTIANCTNLSCSANYLTISKNWGLGTYYTVNSALYVTTTGTLTYGSGSVYNYKNGNLQSSSAGTQLYVRPVITIKNDVKIQSGDGTSANPFKVV